jgi:aminoglycoside phosphotransferase (APT) family kinase protein
MESITKPSVTDEQLERIARKHLGGKPVTTRELKDGWFNSVFLIELAGQRFVLKVAPRDEMKVLRYERNLMAAEVGAMREVKARTGVPVPGIVAYDQTRDEVAGDYFLAEFVPGLPLDQARKEFTPEDAASVDRQIGALLSELHRVDGKTFGTYNQPTFDNWTDAFTSLFEDLRRDQQDAGVELPKDAFWVALPHLGALREAESPVLVHWDLWDGNIFVDPESKQITGLIDFERAMWADPLIEANFREPSSALLEGYDDPILAATGAGERRALYDLYLSLIMVIESTYRRFPPDHEKMCRDFLDRSIAALRGLPWR